MVQDYFMEMDNDADSLPAIDTAFYQKYEPKEILGKGVSSTVRRAVAKETGESFAVKIIDVSQELVDSDGLNLREQTMREINILRLVAGHDNIIELLDVFESSTYIFLIFELAVNGELFDHLNSVVSISEKKARRIMKQILEALKHCHSKGVVHRDIKPENILLDQDYNVKLTDFGFAKLLQTGERLYDVCGTPGYLAPELLKAGMVEKDECDGYGYEVDIWACGVVLYTMLAGFPPFWHRWVTLDRGQRSGPGSLSFQQYCMQGNRVPSEYYNGKQLMMIRQIMEGKYSFTSAEWNDISHGPKDLISKMLLVEHKERLTVNLCLSHEFISPTVSNRRDSLPGEPICQLDQLVPPPNVSRFNAKKCWKLVLHAVQFVVRITRLKTTPEPLCLKTAALSPYKMRSFRKVLDGAAFKVYGHWVKRGEGQNRAAMFELSPKTETIKRETENNEMEVN